MAISWKSLWQDCGENIKNGYFLNQNYVNILHDDFKNYHYSLL